jgi:hypothetical protein
VVRGFGFSARLCIAYSVHPASRRDIGTGSLRSVAQRARIRGRPAALVNGDRRISNASRPSPNPNSILVCRIRCPPSRPTRTLRLQSTRPARHPIRCGPPCGSVKPPTTTFCENFAFHLEPNGGHRRCSCLESRRLAITPSQPLLQARSHGFASVRRATGCHGGDRARNSRMARRSSSARAVRSRPFSQGISSTGIGRHQLPR